MFIGLHRQTMGRVEQKSPDQYLLWYLSDKKVKGWNILNTLTVQVASCSHCCRAWWAKTSRRRREDWSLQVKLIAWLGSAFQTFEPRKCYKSSQLEVGILAWNFHIYWHQCCKGSVHHVFYLFLRLMLWTLFFLGGNCCTQNLGKKSCSKNCRNHEFTLDVMHQVLSWRDSKFPFGLLSSLFQGR